MNRFAFFVALPALTVSSLAFAAPQASPPVGQATAQHEAAPATHSAVKPGDRHCLRDTGSLIRPKKGECLPVSGRSYTKQEIDNTGERTLGPALQKLDPSITLHGNGY